MTAGDTLTRFAEAIDARDWDALAAELAPDFSGLLVHTRETFDRAGFVAFNRDYPLVVRFLTEDLVSSGPRAVLRARVTDGTSDWFVASFVTVDHDGLIDDLVEVWTEAVQSPPDRSTP